jgi:2-polyprenyl-3-methyl-5-hydroxy-6-metoxy-1,4-benzoquinol methylase
MSDLNPAQTLSSATSLEERDCPACGSSARTGTLSREGEFELVRCRECRMLYTHRVRSIAGKIEHYDQMARERMDTTSGLSPAHYGLANQIKSVGLYERVLQFIVKTMPTGNVNFVDVGCAGGLLLLAAQSVDGYNCGVPPRFQVRGISIDPRERSETERSVGCPVLFPDEAAEEWAGWADVVTLMNVLEHVDDPLALLGQLKRILKAGGLLVIDVPNNAVVSLRGGVLGRWPELDLGEHINHFVPGTLDGLLTRAGFAPVRRLFGLFRGIEGIAAAPGMRTGMRWFAASAVMVGTMRKVQLFAHMTMAYRSVPGQSGGLHPSDV